MAKELTYEELIKENELLKGLVKDGDVKVLEAEAKITESSKSLTEENEELKSQVMAFEEFGTISEVEIATGMLEDYVACGTVNNILELKESITKYEEFGSTDELTELIDTLESEAKQKTVDSLCEKFGIDEASANKTLSLFDNIEEAEDYLGQFMKEVTEEDDGDANEDSNINKRVTEHKVVKKTDEVSNVGKLLNSFKTV